MEWLGSFLWNLIDARLIAAIALLVGTVGVFINRRNYHLALERDRRERERERRQQEAAERTRRDFLAAFGGVSVVHGGETIHVAWRGPLADVTEDPAPRVMTADLRTALEQRIREEGVDAQLDTLGTPKGVPVYETDETRSWKRKLKGPPGAEGHYYLKVFL